MNSIEELTENRPLSPFEASMHDGLVNGIGHYRRRRQIGTGIATAVLAVVLVVGGLSLFRDADEGSVVTTVAPEAQNDQPAPTATPNSAPTSEPDPTTPPAPTPEPAPTPGAETDAELASPLTDLVDGGALARPELAASTDVVWYLLPSLAPTTDDEQLELFQRILERYPHVSNVTILNGEETKQTVAELTEAEAVSYGNLASYPSSVWLTLEDSSASSVVEFLSEDPPLEVFWWMPTRVSCRDGGPADVFWEPASNADTASSWDTSIATDPDPGEDSAAGNDTMMRSTLLNEDGSDADLGLFMIPSGWDPQSLLWLNDVFAEPDAPQYFVERVGACAAVQYERTEPTDGSGQFFVAEGAGLLTVVNTNNRIDLMRPAAESLIRSDRDILRQAFVEECVLLDGLVTESSDGGLDVPSLNGEYYCIAPSAATPRAVVESVTVNEDDVTTTKTLTLELTDAGLETINALAELCFAEGPACPTGRAAIMLDGRLQSVTGFGAPVFTENTLVISGFPTLSEDAVAWAADADPRRTTFHAVLEVLDGPGAP